MTTPATPPAPIAPNNLVASAISTSRIDLVWQDTSTNETGFKIERSVDGVNFTQIALIGANSTNYSDTIGLAASTKYYYRIRATNDGGDSAYSSIASATTASLMALPAGWTSADIGPVGLAGGATYDNGTYTVQGAGADIYGNSDGFQFAYEQLTGDGTIIARVTSLTNTDANAKAGIMIRDSLAANAKEASVMVTPLNGLKFLRRGSTGGSTSSTTVNCAQGPLLAEADAQREHDHVVLFNRRRQLDGRRLAGHCDGRDGIRWTHRHRAQDDGAGDGDV